MKPTDYIASIDESAELSGERTLRCFLSNGDIWLCDTNGENWRLAMPPIKELEEKLRAHLANQ